MIITLFTDASFCPTTRLASYAAWAKADGQVLRKSGMLKDLPENSTEAEIKAIINGLYFVLVEMRPPEGSWIIAQTDCKTAMDLFLGKVRSVPAWNGFTSVILPKLHQAKVKTDFRHVKAHKGNSSPKNAVNTWCDQEARRLMRAARKALQEAQCETT